MAKRRPLHPAVAAGFPQAFGQGAAAGERAFAFYRNLAEQQRQAMAAVDFAAQIGLLDDAALRKMTPDILNHLSPDFVYHMTNAIGERMVDQANVSKIEADASRARADADKAGYEADKLLYGTFLTDDVRQAMNMLRQTYAGADETFASMLAVINSDLDGERQLAEVERIRRETKTSGALADMPPDVQQMFEDVVTHIMLEARWDAGLMPRYGKEILRKLNQGDVPGALGLLSPPERQEILTGIQTQMRAGQIPANAEAGMLRARQLIKDLLLPGLGIGKFKMFGQAPEVDTTAAMGAVDAFEQAILDRDEAIMGVARGEGEKEDRGKRPAGWKTFMPLRPGPRQIPMGRAPVKAEETGPTSHESPIRAVGRPPDLGVMSAIPGMMGSQPSSPEAARFAPAQTTEMEQGDFLTALHGERPDAITGFLSRMPGYSAQVRKLMEDVATKKAAIR